jgi:hypothetical protein
MTEPVLNKNSPSLTASSLLSTLLAHPIAKHKLNSEPPRKQVFPMIHTAYPHLAPIPRPSPVAVPLAYLQSADPPPFQVACQDASLTIDPHALGLIPRDTWPKGALPLGVIVAMFFQKRNSKHWNFPSKLYNALLITAECPYLYRYVGIRWVTDEVIIVEKFVFARLLGVRSVDGSLFHQQGNFPSHGFIELSFQEAQEIAAANGIGSVDSHSMRFFRHGSGAFRRNCPEDVIRRLEWTHS